MVGDILRKNPQQLRCQGGKKMKRMDFIKGLSLGLIAAGAIGLALNGDRRRLEKCKNHTIKAIGEAVDKVTDMLGV